MDCGAAAGGDRTAWSAFAARDRCHDRAGLSGAGARAAARHASRRHSFRSNRSEFPPNISTIRAPLTLSTETALQALDGARRKRGARRHKKLVMVTSHGGNSAAMSLSRRICARNIGLLAVTTAWSRFGAPEGLFSAEEIAPRHSWRRGRDIDHAGALSATCAPRGDRRFSPRQHCDGKGLSLAFGASAGAVRVAGAGSSSQRRCRRRDTGFG